MRLKRTTAFILCLSAFFSLAQASEIPDYGFGLELFRSGDFQSAVIELNRYLYYNPGASFTPYVRYLLALSYAHTDQYRKALAQLHRVVNLIDDNSLHDEFGKLYNESLVQLLNILFREKNFSDFQLQAESIDTQSHALNAELQEYVDSMNIAVCIYQFDWDSALAWVRRAEFLKQEAFAPLMQGLVEVKNHHYKSPVLGGVLSLIPGLGHFYAGRTMDGTRSLLINTACASIAVFSFMAGVPFLAAVFGIIEAVMWVANIYGGVNAVLQENARYTVLMRDELLKYLPVPPLDVVTFREDLDLR